VMVVLGLPGVDALRETSLYRLPDRTDPALAAAVLEISRTPSARTTGIVVQPSGFFVDQDTIYLVKTTDKGRWSFGVALDDADRILAALVNGEGNA
jgi:hypothetical protein